MATLWAISDLHLAYPQNRAAFSDITARPGDWLILGGDIAETLADLEAAFALSCERFERVLWVPGNHELWLTSDAPGLCGQAKYDAIVSLARRYRVLTPEDDFARWSDGTVLVPMFLLYDYTFRPPEIALGDVVQWAADGGIVCADEYRLQPAPFATRQAWCHARVAQTEKRLESLARAGDKTVLINHFPLRYDLVYLPFVPRFSPWCGTSLTEQWHRRFNARVAVSGHLHVPSTRTVDDCRFEEVSLGYPRQWHGRVDDRLRRIL